MDETATFPDEGLELISTCCHPALSLDAQVGLTLRTLGGLATDLVAAADRAWRGVGSVRARPG